MLSVWSSTPPASQNARSNAQQKNEKYRRRILLKTRFALDQYINLRPVKLYPNVETPLKDKGPEHIDFVVVRENIGGIYTGIGGVTQKGTPLDVATQVMQYARPVVGSRGEPPSSARRVPSRKGMETLPGFPS